MRYVIAERHEVRLARQERGEEFSLAASLLELSRHPEFEVLSDIRDRNGNEHAIFLVEASDEAYPVLEDTLGDRVWIEPPVPHQLLAFGRYRRIDVADSNGKPLPHCLVEVQFDGDGEEDEKDRGFTDEDGCYVCDARGAIRKVVASPTTGAWPMMAMGDVTRLECRPIQFKEDGIGWWHRCMGLHSISNNQGTGIRIGVIDAGCCQHASLSHVIRSGVYSEGKIDENASISHPHGTHVCGIISSRLDGGQGFWGIAPGAELVVAAVESGYSSMDIGLAIGDLVRNYGVHLINLSLGARTESKSLITAIMGAEQSGCLCVCAAGNDGTDVMWPANSEHAIAVSAIGQRSGLVEDTLPATEVDFSAGDFGLAKFSNRGSSINCCGPGVGIVSAFVDVHGAGHSWWSMSGTSMASPAVAAALAAKLSTLDEFFALPADQSRADYARGVLYKMCQSLGLPREFEGYGLPVIQ